MLLLPFDESTEDVSIRQHGSETTGRATFVTSAVSGDALRVSLSILFCMMNIVAHRVVLVFSSVSTWRVDQNQLWTQSFVELWRFVDCVVLADGASRQYGRDRVDAMDEQRWQACLLAS